MMGLLAAFGALRVTGMNLFRKKVTEPLPWEGGRKRPARYRTSFALVHNEDGDEACIGCKMCEKICPSQIITVVAGGRSQAPKSGKMRGTAKEFTLDLNACIHCELCVQVCPEDAILMLLSPDQPGYSREDVFLSMEKLYANEPAAKSWGTGALLIAMQEPGGPKPPKPAAKPAPKAESKAEAPTAEAPAESSTHKSPQPVDPPPVTPKVPQTEPPPPPPAPEPQLPEPQAPPAKPPQAVVFDPDEPTTIPGPAPASEWEEERTQIRPAPSEPRVVPLKKDGGGS